MNEKDGYSIMASKRQKLSASPASRRQAEQASSGKRRNTPQTKRNRGKRPSVWRSPWVIVSGTVILIAAIIGVFIFLSTQSNIATSNPSGSPSGNLVDATTLKEVTSVDPAVLSQTGTGGIANPFKAGSGSSTLLTGPTGKPEVFFYGAEWCPLCAAERWSIVVALSRFGTFHTLRETTSASNDSYPNTATFAFYPNDYTSSTIDFVPIENADNQRAVLQTPTADQQQILTHYNVTGYPFMDIGDRYVIMSASYDPIILRTNPQDQNSQPLSQQEIASQISSENALSKSVLGAANYLTAAICSITNNQPSAVCGDASIQQIEKTLSQTAQAKGSSTTTARANVPIIHEWWKQD